MTALESLLDNRRWLFRANPFPYATAERVFVPAFYRQLAQDYASLLGKGLSETSAGGALSRSIAGYDAYGVGFTRFLKGSFSVFTSEAWRDMLAGLFGIVPTDYINAGSHHHSVGSPNGFIHNDFNPVWFKKERSDGAPILPAHGECSYKTGAGPLRDDEKVEVVRAVAMIFFLGNDGWAPGDGGETGLFTSAHDAIDRPATRIAPVNNTVVCFECTPHSYHSFLHNRCKPRNSIIMWVHRTKQDALSSWSESQFEHFRV